MEAAPEGFVARKAKGGDLGGGPNRDGHGGFWEEVTMVGQKIGQKSTKKNVTCCSCLTT